MPLSNIDQAVAAPIDEQRAATIRALVLTLGEVDGAENVLARLHSECLTGDLADSLRCDCGAQLRMAMSAIATGGRGAIVYLHLNYLTAKRDRLGHLLQRLNSHDRRQENHVYQEECHASH